MRKPDAATLGPYVLGPNDTPENGVYTGDARELAEALPDESVDLVFTDPVYDDIEAYRWLAETAARVLKPHRVMLAQLGIGYLEDTIAIMRGYGMAYRWTFIWYQSNNMKRADPGFCKFSPILWYEKGRTKPRYPVQDLRNVPLIVGNGQQNKHHRWATRDEIVAYYADAFSGFGDIILDPFTGGGTVPAVCKMLGRRYLAFEIEPDTAQLARDRIRDTQPPLPGLVAEQLELEATE